MHLTKKKTRGKETIACRVSFFEGPTEERGQKSEKKSAKKDIQKSGDSRQKGSPQKRKFIWDTNVSHRIGSRKKKKIGAIKGGGKGQGKKEGGGGRSTQGKKSYDHKKPRKKTKN